MSLSGYKKKRSFNSTPEPTGGKGDGTHLVFVVQKHDATRLHYDFRLEMNGVLKSWAVPKGPSTDPSVKRLAMMVEDHPYDYKNFEGIIPKGNYGAGTVIVWDEGVYEPLEPAATKKENEKLLLKELKAGSVKIRMLGKKLKGEYALVRTKGGEENAWLLIKHRDKYATTTDITKKDKSGVSGKTLAKVEATSTNIYGQKTIEPGTTTKDKKTPAKKTAKKAAAKKAVKKKSAPVKKLPTKVTGAVRSAFPKTVAPMLATLVDKPFDEPGWLYEIKLDGYRCIALCNKGKVQLLSRNNKSFNEKFYPIHEALQNWGVNAVVDGEIAVLNNAGITNFGSLQNWRSQADGELLYYVFDLLWLDGYSLMKLPLNKRRELLQQLLPLQGPIRMSENFETNATDFLKAAGKMGLEGIIAKRADSLYTPGIRSNDWLKIKTHKRHEVVIGGYTQNAGSSKAFSSLLVGVFKRKKLVYTGKIGTGFSDKQQKEMLARFKPLIVSKPPFAEEPDINKPSRFRPNPPQASVTWLKPQLICEVSYAEITADGVMRHPSFEGMREDKKPSEVKEEKAIKTEKLVASKKR
ncbi:non-homologous end-joining DNA ligase [Foetidibacter luteolus]|uniref:non-homologous end-joining DNA ligase n=1 Tax=Foetidibacter luteolus TaxID=2608880 RepID=UPI00129ABB74|nr:non-homologous end-joining DNA ligase [Foetidibacter luteolus]